MPNCLAGLFHHCPCPPARDLGSRVSGLVFSRRHVTLHLALSIGRSVRPKYFSSIFFFCDLSNCDYCQKCSCDILLFFSSSLFPSGAPLDCQVDVFMSFPPQQHRRRRERFRGAKRRRLHIQRAAAAPTAASTSAAFGSVPAHDRIGGARIFRFSKSLVASYYF